MLQRILAAVVAVAGLIAAGLAVASATIWRESDTVVASVTAAKNGTLIVTEPGVLNLVADKVKISATATGDVALVIGREIDVNGWVGDDPVTRVSGLSDWETLASSAVVPTPTPAADADAPSGDASSDAPAENAPVEDAPAEETAAGDAADDADEKSPAPDPVGSDMWFAEKTGAGSAELNWTATPGRWMLLVAATGDDPKPPTLSLTWQRTVTTPLLWPGVIVGGLLLLGGALWFVVAVRSRRQTPKDPTPSLAEEVPEPFPFESHSPVSSGPAEPSPGPDPQAALRAAEPEAITRVMTRREIREHEEKQRGVGRPKRAWLTGSIPVVPRERRPKTAAHQVVDPVSAQARGDAWRRAWGMDKEAASLPVPPSEVSMPEVNLDVPPAAAGLPMASPGFMSPAPGLAAPLPGVEGSALPSRRARRGSHATPEFDVPEVSRRSPAVPSGFGVPDEADVTGPLPVTDFDDPATGLPIAGPTSYDGSGVAGPEPRSHPLRRRDGRRFTDDHDGGRQE